MTIYGRRGITYHDLPDGDHAGAEAVLHTVELAQVPAGHLLIKKRVGVYIYI
jgi:hypothetical protein